MDYYQEGGASMKFQGLLCATLIGFSAAAWADTIHLNTGVSVDGIVTERPDGLYELRVGERTVIYRPSEVRSIERNERTGIMDREEAKARWDAMRKELEEKTGLNVEQRNRVDAILSELRRDGAARVRAREQLVDLSTEINVHQYLTTLLGESTPTLMPWLLEALVIIEPRQTLPILRDHLDHPHYGVRLKVIELLADAGDAASTPQIARGLADDKLEVRIATAYSLARLQARETTPALIESMKHADLRMSNASRDALHAMWQSELDGERKTTVDEWTAFFRSHSSKVNGPIQLAALKPLVLPEYELVLE